MSKTLNTNKKIAIACIVVVLLLPMTFLGPREDISIYRYLIKCVLPLLMVTTFAINYYRLIPKTMSGKGRHSLFVSNLCVILVCCFALFFTHKQEMKIIEQERAKTEIVNKTESKQEGTERKEHKRGGGFWLSVAVLDIINIVFAIFVAYAMRSNEHINDLERQQKEAEMARQKAELKGLKNQISPHFLLNTLNNIYALAAINTERTQKAVMQLSQLLRHTLYDNQQETVSLISEAHFISSYIDLMKLRLTSNVRIDTNINVDESSKTMVAPLLFISLVENAFKHGVAASGTSCISVSLYEDNAHIVCDISNSNHPKMSSDRSGHGIGLTLVQQRLDALYKGRYEWTKGVDEEDIYHSKIVIDKMPITNGCGL